MKPTPLHDKWPRVPRRRTVILTNLVMAAIALGASVFIGWLAAQGF